MTKSLPSEPPDSLPISERRSHRRVKVAVPAEIVVGSQPAAPAALLSLSLGGAAMRAEIDCAVGQPLIVRFRLPDRGWVDFTAELVRVSARSIGVRFLAFDRVSFDALMKLLARDESE